MSTSIPSTCGNNKRENTTIRQVSTELQNAQPFQDALMFLLYSGHAVNLLVILIEECRQNIAASYPSAGVGKALKSFQVSKDSTSIAHLRVIFFLLLSRDAVMRKKLCEGKISWFLPTLCPHKACSFYESLESSVIPVWIRDENVAVQEFEEMLRDCYLSA